MTRGGTRVICYLCLFTAMISPVMALIKAVMAPINVIVASIM